MRILYDFRGYQRFYQRGVARYVQGLFEHAIQHHNSEAYILLYKENVYPEFPTQLSKKIHFLFEEDFVAGFYQDTWFDVFVLGTCYWMNLSAHTAISMMYPLHVLKQCRIKAGIIHDFIPLFFRNWSRIPLSGEKITYTILIDMLKYLDHIFTNSMCTLALGMQYTKIEQEKFTCLYGGVDIQKFSTKNSMKSYTIKNRSNHLVYVSGIAPHKNNEGICRAFCKAYSRNQIPHDAKLYIICKMSSTVIDKIKAIAESYGCKYMKHVEATGYISDDEMIDLLTHARSSIFPSKYEGLGLPILESYAVGTPCWGSGASATREIILPACSFDPFDEESMVIAIKNIYSSPELCKKSLEFGQKLLETKMNWNRAAKALLRTLDILCNKKFVV